MSIILQGTKLCFGYGDRLVLDDFNFSINRGEKVCLLGTSGCGKTSLLRLCAGFERPDSGEIKLRDQVVSSSDVFVAPGERNIGYVFQSFALFEKVSVEKNIFYGCKTAKHKAEAHRLIQLMKLEPHLSKKPFQLSGGEKQKVALARSLALEPDVLFLDEPFSSIDPDQTEFLIKEMKELFNQLKVTVLMVTHSKEESRQFADRILEFNQ